MAAAGEDFPAWIVDGMNVIGSVPDGWWRDRPAAVRSLVARLARHRWPPGTRVTAVFDGRPAEGLDPDTVEVRFAGRGRGSGDDLIVDLIRQRAASGAQTVVTSDRGLAARVSEHGARVVPAGELLRLLDADVPGPEAGGLRT